MDVFRSANTNVRIEFLASVVWRFDIAVSVTRSSLLSLLLWFLFSIWLLSRSSIRRFVIIIIGFVLHIDHTGTFYSMIFLSLSRRDDCNRLCIWIVKSVLLLWCRRFYLLLFVIVMSLLMLASTWLLLIVHHTHPHISTSKLEIQQMNDQNKKWAKIANQLQLNCPFFWRISDWNVFEFAPEMWKPWNKIGTMEYFDFFPSLGCVTMTRMCQQHQNIENHLRYGEIFKQLWKNTHKLHGTSNDVLIAY